MHSLARAGVFVISLSILCIFRPYSHSLARAGVLFRSLRYYLITLSIYTLSSKGRSVYYIFEILFVY